MTKITTKKDVTVSIAPNPDVCICIRVDVGVGAAKACDGGSGDEAAIQVFWLRGISCDDLTAYL